MQSCLFCFSRDMFIDEDMKPKKKLISESNLEYIFNFDEDTQVCILESLSYQMYSHLGVDISTVVYHC